MSAVHWQPGVTLEELEKQAIVAALQFYQQNRTHAASSLGITTRTIQNKLQQYKLAKPEDLEEIEEVAPPVPAQKRKRG